MFPRRRSTNLQVAQDRAIGWIDVYAFGDQFVERCEHRLHRRDLIAQPPDMSVGDRPYAGALPPPIPPERKQLLDLLYQKAEVPRSANEEEGVNVACFVDAVTRSCPFRRPHEHRLLV